jgi:sec-independent protein translocase protein TatA
MFTGTWEWVIILAVVVLLFGGKKLPQLGGAIGESIKNFKKGIKDNTSEIEGKSENKSDKDA